MDALSINDIKMTQFPDELGIGVHHFKAEYLSSAGRLISGFGSALNKQLAAKKAAFELFERMVVRQQQGLGLAKSSNGFAAHVNFKEASKSAVNEIVERDSFLSRWLLRKSPHWLESTTDFLSANSLFKVFTDRMRFFNIRLKIGVIVESVDCCVLTAMIIPGNSENFGFALTSSCGPSFDSCLENILLTISRYCTILINRQTIGMPLFTEHVEFKKAQDHFEYYLNPQNAKKVKWWLENGIPEKTVEVSRLEVNEVVSNFQFPFECSIARAQSNDVQDYYLGTTKFESLCDKMRSVSDLEKFNWEMHPLP